MNKENIIEQETILQIRVNRVSEDFELVLVEQNKFERLALHSFLKAYVENLEEQLKYIVREEYFEEGEEE
jgi:hypothetical protein